MDIWEEERGEGVDDDDGLRAVNYSFLFTMGLWTIDYASIYASDGFRVWYFTEMDCVCRDIWRRSGAALDWICFPIRKMACGQIYKCILVTGFTNMHSAHVPQCHANTMHASSLDRLIS